MANSGVLRDVEVLISRVEVHSSHSQVEEDFDDNTDIEVEDTEPASIFPKVREIFQQHGWPNLTQYRKDDCIRAVGEEWESFCQRVYD